MNGWMRQVELYRKSDGSTMVCWLRDDERWKIGMQVKLIGAEGWWRVTAVYQRAESRNIERGWRVGGLT